MNQIEPKPVENPSKLAKQCPNLHLLKTESLSIVPDSGIPWMAYDMGSVPQLLDGWVGFSSEGREHGRPSGSAVIA